MARNDSLFNELERLFAQRNEYDKLIYKQKQALCERDYSDENQGGGRSSFISKPTETMAIKFADDEYIKDQIKYKKAIEETLEELEDNERELIEEKYWGGYSWANWKDFAHEKHFSTSSMSRLKQKVLVIFGRKINKIGLWE